MPLAKSGVRAFLDANVLFSAAYRERGGLSGLWKLKQVQLLTSSYAAQEAANNLDQESHLSRLRTLLADVEIVGSGTGMSATFGIVLPDKDRPILAAAIESKADFLLTGDIRHFGRYFNTVICGIRVLQPAQFLKLYRT